MIGRILCFLGLHLDRGHQLLGGQLLVRCERCGRQALL